MYPIINLPNVGVSYIFLQRRRTFQKAAVIYHARLNAAHFEREMIPLNAFFGFLTTLRNHSKSISQVVEQPSVAQFAEVIKSNFDWWVHPPDE